MPATISALNKSSMDRFIASPLPSDERDIANWKLLNNPAPLDQLPWAERIYVQRIALECLNRSYEKVVSDPIVNRSYFSSGLSPRGNFTQPKERKLYHPHHVPSHPQQTLDAPELLDDYYLNVLDWSQSNMIAIGLNDKVYLWNRATSQTTGPMDFSADVVTSVKFLGNGEQLLVGLQSGNIQLWQVTPNPVHIRTFHSHHQRVGTIDKIAEELFASGSRDSSVRIFDRRTPNSVMQLYAHTQEVCKVVTSLWDSYCLASGSNDNLLRLHDLRNHNPAPSQQWSYTHEAGIKAIDFSPLSRRWLVSGGGTADRSIRIFDLSSRELFQQLDGGSQVTNLFWSRCPFDPTIVSTFGYSEKCLKVWHQEQSGNLCPIPLATLPSLDKRILFAAPQPNGAEIAVAAGNETLLIYTVFDPSKASHKNSPIGKNRKLGPLDQKTIR